MAIVQMEYIMQPERMGSENDKTVTFVLFRGDWVQRAYPISSYCRKASIGRDSIDCKMIQKIGLSMFDM